MTRLARYASTPNVAAALVLLAALLVSFALTARSDADAPVTHTVARANLDGTGVDQSFISGGGAYPFGIAVDATHIYWTTAYGSGGSVNRANLDGSGIDQSFMSGVSTTRPYGIAVDANHIYWTNSDFAFGYTIGRANIDGLGINQSFINGSGPLDSYGVAVDSTHIYWTNDLGSTIGRADLDGTNVGQNFVTDAGFPRDVAVNANHVYWTNDSPPPTLPCGSTCGTEPPDTIPPNTVISKGAPSKTDKTKLKFKFKSSEPNSTFECRLDKNKFKACESPKTVRRLDVSKHKFQVRATDAAGNVDPTPAKDKFKVVG